jgi:molybdopterin-guanine dinucleotide biosynthesis adapter protein
MTQRAVAFSGYSNSGKTTLICRLIEHFTAMGVDVGAIKHTHHSLDDATPEGDTGRFLSAGATIAILAGAGEALIFQPSEPSVRFAWTQHSQLASRISTPLILIEGFKSVGIWPKVLVGSPDSTVPPADPTVIACVNAVLPGVRSFSPEDIEGLAGFLDRILLR